MPTFIVYKGGKKLKDLVGASPQALQVRSSPLHMNAIVEHFFKALVASVSN